MDRQQRLYETIVSNTPDLVYAFDLDYRFTFANPALLAMWGRTLAESVGRRLIELGYEPWHAQMHEREIDQVVATKRPIRGEVSFPHATLGRRIYDYIFVPVFNEAGEVESVAGTTRDVTDRKRTELDRERLLREVEAERKQLAEVFDHAPSAMCILRGSELVFERANASYLRLVGNRGILGKTIREAFAEIEEQGFIKLLEDVLATGKTVRGTDVQVMLHRQEDSDALEERWLDFVYQPLRDAEGKITGVFVQGVDLTERHRVQEALRESEARYRALFKSMDEGFCVMEVLFDDENRPLDYRWVETNPAFERHTGIRPVVGKTAREQVPGLEQHWVDIYGQVALTGESRRFVEVSEAMGRAFEVEAFRIGPPEQRRVALLFNDITARTNAEKELRAARDELEQRVAERTTEIGQQARRLRQLANEVASAEQRERKRLAAMLHDELQQYLVAAKIRLQNARSHVTDPRAERPLNDSAEMIDRALDSSRDLTRQLRPPVLYEDGLVPALRWLAGEMKQRHELSVRVEADELKLSLDDDAKAMLFECVRELLFNVVKHAGVNEARLTVERPPGRLILRVEDEGVGLTPEMAERMSNDEATGLGLFSIGERLAAIEGGIDIESAPGSGTRITLKVPLDSQEEAPGGAGAAAQRVEARRESPTAGAQAAERGPRVLVADDHTLVRRGVAALLQETGRLTVVAEAADGDDALRLVERHQPDVVLMDLNMPRMNGMKATREIRRRWPRIQVIGISIQDDETTARSLQAAGAAAFVSKSDDAERIREVILRVWQAGQERG